MENLYELQLSQSPTVSAAKKEEPVQASDNKLSYEAQKEQNKKIRKLEKQVADCETLIERLEKEVAELEERMAIGDFTTSKKAKKSSTRRSGNLARRKAFNIVSSSASLNAT